MHKVICEEPRRGGGRQKQSRRANLPLDLLPKKEGMRRPYRWRKWFGEHLSPLRRWLRSQVGRPWNDVYGEACQVIKPDSVVRNHIKFHLLQFVQRHTFMRDGHVWCFTNCRRDPEVPVEELATRWTPFHVHPESGLLCETPRRAERKPSYEQHQYRLKQVRRWMSDSQLLLLIDGLWFRCEMRPILHWSEEPFDVVFKLRLDSSHALEAYGKCRYCAGKRQLSHGELKSFGLVNSPWGVKSGIGTAMDQDLLERMRRSNANPVGRRIRNMVELVFRICRPAN